MLYTALLCCIVCHIIDVMSCRIVVYHAIPHQPDHSIVFDAMLCYVMLHMLHMRDCDVVLYHTTIQHVTLLIYSCLAMCCHMFYFVMVVRRTGGIHIHMQRHAHIYIFAFAYIYAYNGMLVNVCIYVSMCQHVDAWIA